MRKTRSLPTCAAQQDYYTSNLGVLQPVIEQPVGPADDPYAMQRVSPDSFSGKGYYVDGTAIFGSLVLLIILLALTLERILGLDRFINQAIQKWKESRQYQRRNDVIKARQALEDSWDNEDVK